MKEMNLLPLHLNILILMVLLKKLILGEIKYLEEILMNQEEFGEWLH